jgi:hypothetical protein
MTTSSNKDKGVNSKKIILDLCGGTGAWSAPYKRAGYDVRVITLPKQNIFSFVLDRKEKVYGVLSAPPCTMFSLARTTAKKPRDIDGALLVVGKCLAISWNSKPKFWAMENPKGLLRKFMGKPAFQFDASEFGEKYNKHTDLWGYFKEPKKVREYKRYKSTDKNTRKLPDIPKDYVIDPEMSKVAIKRSITPAGFADAFYKANL